MHIDQEQFFKSAFDEIGDLMRDDLVKEALGAGLMQGLKTFGRAAGRHARSVGQAGLTAAKNPSRALGSMRGTYTRAGGGLKGVGAVMRTPVGQAATAAGLGAVAVPTAVGYGMGRRR